MIVKKKDIVKKEDVHSYPKKPYNTPRLIFYGTLEKITGKPRGTGDGGNIYKFS